jgi:hypothetical protein
MHLKEENFSILNKPQAVFDHCVSGGGGDIDTGSIELLFKKF